MVYIGVKSPTDPNLLPALPGISKWGFVMVTFWDPLKRLGPHNRWMKSMENGQPLGRSSVYLPTIGWWFQAFFIFIPRKKWVVNKSPRQK